MIEVEARAGVTDDDRCPKCGTALLPSTMNTRRTRELRFFGFVLSMEREDQEFHPCEVCHVPNGPSKAASLSDEGTKE